MHIPLVPLEQAVRSHPLITTSRVFDRLSEMFRDVALRSAPPTDHERWHEHTIDGTAYRFTQPLTLTPYASSRPCSARCRFCSENLRSGAEQGVPASLLRPGADYFSVLRQALAQLKGLPLSYSLSGLESTDDPDWLLALLHTLRTASAAGEGPVVGESVLYSNGAGLVTHGDALIPALVSTGVSWVEWSRHHDQDDRNQKIMRFRDGQSVAQQAEFEHAVRQVAGHLPVKMVCVVQRGGIETAHDVQRYVHWAKQLGASMVIFREFSALPAHYQANATRRYVDDARIAIDDLMLACLEAPAFWHNFEPLALTGGYYFWNSRWQHRDGFEIVFERSDYGLMLEREASGLIYKLVFHANGNLCAGWQPERNVLWSAHGGR
ncbi:MAG: hypothetical protein ABW190_11650 [Rhizobacter sp.]